MPELPDVESFRILAQRRFRDDAVRRVTVSDPAILEGATDTTLRQRLKDRPLLRTQRHGKYLFLDFGEATVLVMHFGPAGALRVFSSDRESRLTSGSASTSPADRRLLTSTLGGSAGYA